MHTRAGRGTRAVLSRRSNTFTHIVAGGKLVLAQFTIDDEGQFDGNTKEKKVSMHHKMCELWRGMVDDGTITEVGGHQMTRTVRQPIGPLQYLVT